jgi:large subunit ribosomal protein L7Ae
MAKGKKVKSTKPVRKSDKAKRNPLFERTPRNYRIGGDIQPVRDLSRTVRWPKYIRLQRYKKILLERLKVPAAIAQFRNTIDRSAAATLFRLLANYKPETKSQKKERLLAAATAKVDDKAKKDTKGKKEAGPKPVVLKFGLNHITHLVEQKKARLVVIAHDVDPIELVLWLPQLCRRMEVTFCFVKGKARLGKLVGKKTATAVAIKDVSKEHHAEFESLLKTFRSQFNDNSELRKVSEPKLGHKSQHVRDARDRAIANEQVKKTGL